MTLINKKTPQAVVFTLFMSFFLYFFVVANNGSLEYFWASRIYAVYLGVLFFLMMNSEEKARYRRIFFAGIALMFFPTFIANLFEGRGSMSISNELMANSETPFCHIVIPMTFISMAIERTVIFPARMTNHYAAIYSMLVIWALASLSLGRGWCSWVCFYGGWDDFFSRLPGKKRVKLNPANESVRFFQFSMLIFLVLASLITLTVVYCEWFCPFKLITEYAEVTDFQSLIAFILMILIFFGGVIVLPLLSRRRFNCALLCPFGAFQSLIGKISPFRLIIDTDKCSGCMKCTAVCPTLSIAPVHIKEKKGKPGVSCTLCGECISACPEKAISYKLGHFTVKKKAKGWLADWFSAENFFVFTAFLFGSIISSRFGSGTLFRLIRFLGGDGFIQ